jgi:hypothetical protein
MPIITSPHTGHKLKIPIKNCDHCGKPILKMNRVHMGRGTFKMVWSQRQFCSEACKKKRLRMRAVSQKYDRIVLK